MADNVLINKAAIIERCLKRVRDEYAACGNNFRKDFTRQDSVILNLERACEAAIDIAMRLVRKHRLGLPQESRESFDFLEKAGKVPAELAVRLKSMIGFRNVAVHDYQILNLDVVERIIRENLTDFEEWAQIAITEAAS